jgi:hypothetical protein
MQLANHCGKSLRAWILPGWVPDYSELRGVAAALPERHRPDRNHPGDSA